MRNSGAGIIAEQQNQGISLSANTAYVFDVFVEGEEKIDFQTSVAGTILN